MATSKYFSQVEDKGFIAFGENIDQSAWEQVDAEAYISGAKPIKRDDPKDVTWKVRLMWAISAVVTSLGLTSTQEVRRAEGEWDSAQQRLHLKTDFDALDRDPAIREAAQRVRAALLLGDGLAQTNLPWAEEVEFGLTQLRLAGEPTLAPDITALKLQPLLDDIRATTAALAAALNINPDKNRDAARSVQARRALSECRRAFRDVLEDLDWHVSVQPTPQDAADLERLRAPLVALHARYSAPIKKAAAPAPGGDDASA